MPEPWLSKYRGVYDDGYEALKARRISGAKQAGLIPEEAPAPARHPIVRPWESLSEDEQAWESRAMEAYAGMVDAMDYNIGRIIDFLEDIGELDNTIILFTVDNGPNPLDAEQYPSNAGTEWFASFDNSIDNIGRRGSFVGYGIGWASASAGPLDYFKLTVGEGGIRTPLIVTGPGVDRDRQTDSFAYVTDIMPTILEIAGLDHPDTFGGRDVESMRGRSLRGLLSGSEADPYSDDVVVGREHQYRANGQQ